MGPAQRPAEHHRTVGRLETRGHPQGRGATCYKSKISVLPFHRPLHWFTIITTFWEWSSCSYCCMCVYVLLLYIVSWYYFKGMHECVSVFVLYWIIVLYYYCCCYNIALCEALTMYMDLSTQWFDWSISLRGQNQAGQRPVWRRSDSDWSK